MMTRSCLPVLLAIAAAGCHRGTKVAEQFDRLHCSTPQMVFAPPNVPLFLTPSKTRKLLILRDHGALSVRDANTLRVVRYLKPDVDRWEFGELLPDGRYRSGRVQGLSFVLDPQTGATVPAATNKGAGEADENAVEGDDSAPSSDLLQPWELSRLDARKALEELQSLVDKSKGLVQSARAWDIDEEQGRALVATRNQLVAIDLASHAATSHLEPTWVESVVAVAVGVDGFAAATEGGDLYILNQALEVQRKLAVPLRRTASLRNRRIRVEEILKDFRRTDVLPVKPEQVVRLVASDLNNIIWLTDRGRLGLTDGATGKTLALESAADTYGVPATLVSTFLVGILDGELTSWDLRTGMTVRIDEPEFRSVVSWGSDSVLAARYDGVLEVRQAGSLAMVGEPWCLEAPCPAQPSLAEIEDVLFGPYDCRQVKASSDWKRRCERDESNPEDAVVVYRQQMTQRQVYVVRSPRTNTPYAVVLPKIMRGPIAGGRIRQTQEKGFVAKLNSASRNYERAAEIAADWSQYDLIGTTTPFITSEGHLILGEGGKYELDSIPLEVAGVAGTGLPASREVEYRRAQRVIRVDRSGNITIQSGSADPWWFSSNERTALQPRQTRTSTHVEFGEGSLVLFTGRPHLKVSNVRGSSAEAGTLQVWCVP